MGLTRVVIMIILLPMPMAVTMPTMRMTVSAVRVTMSSVRMPMRS